MAGCRLRVVLLVVSMMIGRYAFGQGPKPYGPAVGVESAKKIAGIALAQHATLATRNIRHFGDLTVPVVRLDGCRNWGLPARRRGGHCRSDWLACDCRSPGLLPVARQGGCGNWVYPGRRRGEHCLE